jgi:hypothetical protein
VCIRVYAGESEKKKHVLGKDLDKSESALSLWIDNINQKRVPVDWGEEQSHYRSGETLRFQEVEASRFQDIWHVKLVELSALRTGRLNPQEIYISVRG